MSFASSGGGRGSPVLPPEKGVFPLDHFGECAPRKAAYLACLDAHGANGATVECRKLAKQYLECRMGKVRLEARRRGRTLAVEAHFSAHSKRRCFPCVRRRLRSVT